MSFLLHLDACVAYLRRRRWVVHHASQHRRQLHVAAVTITELELWLVRATTPSRYLFRYQALLQDLIVLPVDDAIAHRAAAIGSRLRSQRRTVPIPALLVAGTAVVHGFTLVTRQGTTFAGIPGLSVVDWCIP
jgi:predicted nucleic acid-binding protein